MDATVRRACIGYRYYSLELEYGTRILVIIEAPALVLAAGVGVAPGVGPAGDPFGRSCAGIPGNMWALKANHQNDFEVYGRCLFLWVLFSRRSSQKRGRCLIL